MDLLDRSVKNLVKQYSEKVEQLQSEFLSIQLPKELHAFKLVLECLVRHPAGTPRSNRMFKRFSQNQKRMVRKMLQDKSSPEQISIVTGFPIQFVLKVDKLQKSKKPGGRSCLDRGMQCALAYWIGQARREGRRVSAESIKRKAKQLSRVQGFRASNGWYQKFKERIAQ